MANIAVGRIRKRALLVEDALEALASRMFSFMQRSDPTKYQTDGGKEFLLRQLPSPRITVAAHTSSPVYAEQTMVKAKLLLDAGAIDLPTYVEMIDPPRVEVLRAKAKELQDGQAQVAKKKLEIEERKATRPARR
jgi:hypothetical protein